MGTEDGPTPAEAAPLLRVVNADATPEEIAALVAVLASLGGGAGAAAAYAGVAGAPPQGAGGAAPRTGRLALQRPAPLTAPLQEAGYRRLLRCTSSTTDQPRPSASAAPRQASSSRHPGGRKVTTMVLPTSAPVIRTRIR